MKQIENVLASSGIYIKADVFNELYKKASEIKAAKSLILLKHSLNKYINN